MEENKVNNAPIDNDVLEELEKAQIDKGVESLQQIGRVEINFYAELLSQFKEFNKGLEKLYQTLNMIGAEKLTAYFREFTNNYKHEESVQKVKNQIAKSHKKSSKKLANNTKSDNLQ